ncbi:HicB protein [Geitlerinema sp. FC II]|uniref:type II toxin-antitoxin system HicB family antitoxin n=1 Tax=Baaleninema simplex TaxID=2862350 RepID=UPI0003496DF1|nr:type II toxin-antitoxin system HicB family antitoxin [Baaleninema simplex]MDC0834053.1 type II toxin-antitoxin system HicB family antitoxin [Geitlerinema sp. CS-897]PPT08789.1 HicB protein [Geitlerinema sp. FC II]
MFKYKGYTGNVEIDIESKFLHGRILDIKDVVTFEGSTVEELEKAFQDSVDDYLELCEELGEEPDKPFSGNFPFRTTPELHHQIFLASKKAGKSMNAWMEEVLLKAIEQNNRRTAN